MKIESILLGGKVEWQRFELKVDFHPTDVIHTLCAFANDFHNMGGGYLVIGVAEKNGQPVLPPQGLQPSELDAIQKAIRGLGHKIVPEYHPLVVPCEFQGRWVLQIWAAGGDNRPYCAPKTLGNKKQGVRDGELAFYIRRHSETIELKRNSPDWSNLMELTAKVPFDDRLNGRATLEDVESELVTEHLKIAGSPLLAQVKSLSFEELLRKMRLVDGPPELLRPRNVALMFFNAHPEEFFPESQINILQFPNGVTGQIIRKKFEGPIGAQLFGALDYLKNQILKQVTVKERGRERSVTAWNYPYEAIEEILPNAVYHRSYEQREPIEVRIEPHQISITSYPGPDPSIKLSDMKKGKLIARTYRNRRIGDLLRQIDLAEEAGTGIPTTFEAMQSNGSPRPRFETNEERSYFTAILPVHPAFLKGNLELGGGSAGVLRGGKKSEIPPRNTPLHPRERQILEACVTPRSRAEIQRVVGLRDAKHLRDRYLTPLIERDWLRLTQPANISARDQKYHITRLGEKQLKAPTATQNSLFD